MWIDGRRSGTQCPLRGQQQPNAATSAENLMSISLNRASGPLQRCVLHKGTRTFALLGKATGFGVTAFNRADLHRSWALTAEFGCLRLERLAGDEELTGGQIVLPTPTNYDFGVTGPGQGIETTRAIFGLLPNELEKLVSGLRQGSAPVLGYSRRDLRCSLSCCLIPGQWPHVVISNRAIYGNIVSLESFMRMVVSSLPEGRLGTRFPALQPVFKQMMKLRIVHRRGVPYSDELLETSPVTAMALASR